MAKNGMGLNPNSSKQINSDVIGEFVTEQKTEPMPMAAQRVGSKPSNTPKAEPKVAPINILGTISPPLNPQPMVIIVNKIFNANA